MRVLPEVRKDVGRVTLPPLRLRLSQELPPVFSACNRHVDPAHPVHLHWTCRLERRRSAAPRYRCEAASTCPFILPSVPIIYNTPALRSCML